GCGDEALAPAAADPAAAADEGQQAPEWAVKRAAELGGGVRPEDVMGPHAIEADLFHPERREVRPALGGRIIAHLEAQPANLCYPIENSATCTFILRDIHAALLRFNWETWKQDLDLATRMDIEDTLILKGGRGDDNRNIVFGQVSEEDDAYVVTSGSPHNPIESRRVPKSEVESLQRGTVFTFELRQDARWHDGHPFDADDVVFSVELYQNKQVDCDEKRFRFEEIVQSEKLGEHACRFFYARQYFSAVQTFNETLCLLPSHLYDLKDPDNPDHKAEATESEQGTYINENPHNIDFVGLGPYKLVKWERDQYLEAERFDGFYDKDPRRSGYADTLRWRYVQNDDAAFQALLNGELQIFRRVKTEDYFGELTQQPVFVENFYKAYTYYGQYGYTSWNLYRPKFADVRVRRALTHAFDGAGWVKNKYMGLAVQVTGPAFFLAPVYNHEVKPLAYDPAKAEELLAEAGWYDRTGDGIVDKDGEEFVIEFLYPAGNKASESFGQKLQESYAKVGMGVELAPLEWASFLERILDREFDACNLAWVLPEPESDPMQIWHSSEAAREKRSSNHSGYADPESDALIDQLRVELDDARRMELWHRLHARIYELQPYLFGQTPPGKYAFDRKLRGVKLYNFAPGYSMRDMYYEEGTPGTRPLGSN
ncbi:MAG TPA: ABC transporter substrate-binding protein, partial [Planctomycetota bacterium]|nr:ABC transporter substrate-binding protein [Planctomycetota bacterium]